MKPPKNIIILISWAILILGVIFIHFKPPANKVPLKKSFIYVPFEIGDWKAKEKPASDYLAATLGADDIFLREFENNSGEKLELYFSYFEYTKENKAPHAPQLCWVGSGWSFKDLGEEKLKLETKKPSYAVIKKLLAQRNNEKVILIYCYKINDKYVADFSKFRALAVVDSIFKRKNCAFTLQLTSDVGSENPKDKEKIMKDFLKQALSLLETDFLP